MPVNNTSVALSAVVKLLNITAIVTNNNAPKVSAVDKKLAAVYQWFQNGRASMRYSLYMKYPPSTAPATAKIANTV